MINNKKIKIINVHELLKEKALIDLLKNKTQDNYVNILEIIRINSNEVSNESMYIILKENNYIVKGKGKCIAYDSLDGIRHTSLMYLLSNTGKKEINTFGDKEMVYVDRKNTEEFIIYCINESGFNIKKQALHDWVSQKFTTLSDYVKVKDSTASEIRLTKQIKYVKNTV